MPRPQCARPGCGEESGRRSVWILPRLQLGVWGIRLDEGRAAGELGVAKNGSSVAPVRVNAPPLLGSWLCWQVVSEHKHPHMTLVLGLHCHKT